MSDDATTPLPGYPRSTADQPDDEPLPGDPVDAAGSTAPPGTDDADAAAGLGGSGAKDGDKRPGGRNRRRRVIIWSIAGAVVLVVLAGCLTAGAVVSFGVGLADRANDNDRKWDRLEQSCLELETRLNRLTPPGATGGDPRQRARAINAENAAVRLLLDELAAMNADREHGRDRHRDEWADQWRQLVRARTEYADALRRQPSTEEPAFFVSPRSADGDPVVSAVRDDGPRECAGPVRRLSHPDL